MKANEWLRASYTKRWTIINTTKSQSVAEHSFNVIGIAMRLATAFEWNGRFHYAQQLDLISWAMTHDIVEIYTGDMPTPFKRALESRGAKMLEAEQEFMPEYGGMCRQAEGTVHGMIVKFADILEAIWFLKDHGVGKHASDVLTGLYDAMYDMIDKYEKDHPDLKIRAGMYEVRKEMGL